MRQLEIFSMVVPVMAGVAAADFVGPEAGFTFPGNGSDSSDIIVPVSETITDVNVGANSFTHSWVGGPTMTLTGPGGSVDLMVRFVWTGLFELSRFRRRRNLTIGLRSIAR